MKTIQKWAVTVLAVVCASFVVASASQVATPPAAEQAPAAQPEPKMTTEQRLILANLAQERRIKELELEAVSAKLNNYAERLQVTGWEIDLTKPSGYAKKTEGGK